MSLIHVPETTLSNGLVVSAFKISKFACSKDANGRIAMDRNLKPWVDVTFSEANAACNSIGLMLERESQRLAIIQNVLSVPKNWTKGNVGLGKLKRGLRKGTVTAAQAADYISADPKEYRVLRLNNGEEIYDINGNVFNWIFDDIQGNEQGVIARAFAPDSPSITAPYPRLKKGFGWYPDKGADWSGDAIVRGGCFNSGDLAGIFDFGSCSPETRLNGVGFRCTMNA